MKALEALEALERLKEMGLSDDDILLSGQIAQILGISQSRTARYIRPKNSNVPSRLKSNFNPVYKAYEVRVRDLREFIVNDYAIATPGRPKRKEKPTA
jgi:predicted transcriptional regulator